MYLRRSTLQFVLTVRKATYIPSPAAHEISIINYMNMDKKTFEALQEIIGFAQHASTPTEHADAHYKAFKQIDGWMQEVAKELYE